MSEKINKCPLECSKNYFVLQNKTEKIKQLHCSKVHLPLIIFNMKLFLNGNNQ